MLLIVSEDVCVCACGACVCLSFFFWKLLKDFFNQLLDVTFEERLRTQVLCTMFDKVPKIITISSAGSVKLILALMPKCYGI